ncbi:MAG: helix-turn-helix domain-containing protein [Chloroflexota bacterium]|nr:helix-turn-helix domain-containing protein [Chloroflexota bacterium]
MPELLLLRPLTEAETTELGALAHGHKVEARLRDRARICWLSHEGKRVREIVARVGIRDATVRHWITRFNAHGLPGLADAPRVRRPPTSTPEQIGTVIATSLTPPDDLGLPFASWTLDRLAAYLHEECGIAIKRSRIGELLQAEGVRWRTQETWFGARVDPAFAEKRGDRRPLHRAASRQCRDLPGRDGPGIGQESSRA